jgi:hypothetical protein
MLTLATIKQGYQALLSASYPWDIMSFALLHLPGKLLFHYNA